MRPLVIGPDEREHIARVVEYSRDPAHYYRLGQPPPGEHPAHVVWVPTGFRCVFSITTHQRTFWRHLSISTPNNEGRVPSPEACVMLGKEFGFTTSDDSLDLIRRMKRDGWIADLADAGVVTVVQKIPTGESE